MAASAKHIAGTSDGLIASGSELDGTVFIDLFGRLVTNMAEAFAILVASATEGSRFNQGHASRALHLVGVRPRLERRTAGGFAGWTCALQLNSRPQPKVERVALPALLLVHVLPQPTRLLGHVFIALWHHDPLAFRLLEAGFLAFLQCVLPSEGVDVKLVSSMVLPTVHAPEDLPVFPRGATGGRLRGRRCGGRRLCGYLEAHRVVVFGSGLDSFRSCPNLAAAGAGETDTLAFRMLHARSFAFLE
mmetsp:Transcript_120127/g.285413  ORF Transcript_120127/g.285413 Transcript_120127/m.285413 type:complete len:246 (-) Transcript_120127:596-1333(-)